MDPKSPQVNNYFAVRTRFINTPSVWECRAPFAIEFEPKFWFRASSLPFPAGTMLSAGLFHLDRGVVRKPLQDYFRIESGGANFIVPVEAVRCIRAGVQRNIWLEEGQEGIEIWRKF